MRPGTKPKPTKTHELEGTLHPTRHRHRKREPEAKGDLKGLRPPARLTESQRELWEYAVQNAPIGVVKHIDRDVLLIWVTAIDTHSNAQTALDKANAEPEAIPYMVKREDGHVMNPLVRVVNQAALIALRASEHLGFSPVSRPRLAKEAGEELDVPTFRSKGDGDILEEANVTSLKSFVKNHPK